MRSPLTRRCQECGCSEWVPIGHRRTSARTEEVVYRCVACDAYISEVGYRLAADIVIK